MMDIITIADLYVTKHDDYLTISIDNEDGSTDSTLDRNQVSKLLNILKDWLDATDTSR